MSLHTLFSQLHSHVMDIQPTSANLQDNEGT